MIHVAHPQQVHPLAAQADLDLVAVPDGGRVDVADGPAHDLRAAEHTVVVRVESPELTLRGTGKPLEILGGLARLDDAVTVGVQRRDRRVLSDDLRQRGRGRRHGQVAEHVGVTYELGRIGEHRPTRRVVPVVVAVDDVAHRHAESRRELLFQPQRELRAERVGEDDPLGRHQECRSGSIGPCVVHAPIDVRDAAHDLLGEVSAAQFGHLRETPSAHGHQGCGQTDRNPDPHAIGHRALRVM